MRIYNSSTRNHAKKIDGDLEIQVTLEKLKQLQRNDSWEDPSSLIHTPPPPATWSTSDFTWPLQFPKAIANEEPCHLCLLSLTVNLPLPKLCFTSNIESQCMCTYLCHPFHMLKASAHVLCVSSKVNDCLIHQDASSSIESDLCKSPA